MSILKDKIIETIQTNKFFQYIATYSTYSIEVTSNFYTSDNKAIVSSDNKILKAKEE